MISIPLYLTQKHNCSYLEQQQAQSLFVHPDFTLTSSVYAQLLAQGFRRSGDQVYKPGCGECSACIPVRIPVKTFQASRIQKRILNKNHATEINILPSAFEIKHYRLYQRYQRARHQNSTMVDSSPEDYMGFLTCTWCETFFVEFLIDQQLAAVAIVDQLENVYSAVYTFFDPEFSHFSPGIYAILWQINQAKKQKLEYVYLGFWIKNCRKMAYKNQFRPFQIYRNSRWQD